MKTKETALILAATALLAAGGRAVASTDGRIESAVKNSYTFKNYLKDDDIKIEAKDGVVTLTGTVSEQSHKSLAKDTAQNLPGVKRVEERLNVRSDAPAERSDAWITTKVKTALLFHRSVSASGTEVETRDGVVVLSGRADSGAQKSLTEEYVRDVDGVKSVDNRMTVGVQDGAKASGSSSLDQKFDDASVTAEAKAALMFHRSTSAFNTSVKTQDGVVTLRGHASSDAEKALAGKVVSDVKGVKSVHNQITVE